MTSAQIIQWAREAGVKPMASYGELLLGVIAPAD